MHKQTHSELVLSKSTLGGGARSELGECTSQFICLVVPVWIAMILTPTFFSFFFLVQPAIVDFVNCEQMHYLQDSQITLFNNFFY